MPSTVLPPKDDNNKFFGGHAIVERIRWLKQCTHDNLTASHVWLLQQPHLGLPKG